MPLHQVLPLKGAVQHYDWGGYNFIPTLIGQENPHNQPFAELWMGAHAAAPSIVIADHQTMPLDQLIEKFPKETLGEKVQQQFEHRLPFLFKVLDVRKMLSIQAHPSKKQAEAGFERENKLGIPLHSPQRIYKDANHKPELMLALTDFWLLHGFQSFEKIMQLLHTTPAFAPLAKHFQQEKNLYPLYKYVMELPQESVNQLLKPLYLQLSQKLPKDKSEADFWAWRAFQDTSKEGNYDRGIFSIYFFNLVHLKPGEAIYQAAGIPHAYLEGVNVELMANSDNVFRGGLTTKALAVDELLQSLVFEPIVPNVIAGNKISEAERIFPTPAPDFVLSQIELSAGASVAQVAAAPQILLVMEGAVTVDKQPFSKGAILFVPVHLSYTIEASEKAVLFKATLP